MTPKVLFHARPDLWDSYREPLATALREAGVAAEVSPDLAPDTADYVIYAPWRGGTLDLSACPRLKAVLSLWAGVETIVDAVPPDVPLARMVDHGLTQGMVEYVTGHVLRHHLGMDAHIVNPGHRWQPVTPPFAPERPVTVLGLGKLGTACAQALTGLGFPVTGWSRRPREVEGVRTFSGPEGLGPALDGAQILVLLLPRTPQTEGIVDAAALDRLAPGAVVINPGRGALIDDAALLAALDRGQVGHATLDTFRIEPLPPEDPYWRHPRVTVTPHIAAETHPPTAARVIAENIRRGEAGEPLLHLVDRSARY